MFCIKLMYERFDWLVSVSASIWFESGWGNFFCVVACSRFYKIHNKGLGISEDSQKLNNIQLFSIMKSIYCRYSKEQSHFDGAFEYPKYIINIDLKMIKRNCCCCFGCCCLISLLRLPVPFLLHLCIHVLDVFFLAQANQMEACVEL